MIPMDLNDHCMATIDVVSGQLEVRHSDELAPNPDGALTAWALSPWGAEEYGMERADEALTGLGWRRLSPEWTQSDAPASEWTCEVDWIR